jgi:hypothetical protein
MEGREALGDQKEGTARSLTRAVAWCSEQSPWKLIPLAGAILVGLGTAISWGVDTWIRLNQDRQRRDIVRHQQEEAMAAEVASADSPSTFTVELHDQPPVSGRPVPRLKLALTNGLAAGDHIALVNADPLKLRLEGVDGDVTPKLNVTVGKDSFQGQRKPDGGQLEWEVAPSAGPISRWPPGATRATARAAVAGESVDLTFWVNAIWRLRFADGWPEAFRDLEHQLPGHVHFDEEAGCLVLSGATARNGDQAIVYLPHVGRNPAGLMVGLRYRAAPGHAIIVGLPGGLEVVLAGPNPNEVKAKFNQRYLTRTPGTFRSHSASLRRKLATKSPVDHWREVWVRVTETDLLVLTDPLSKGAKVSFPFEAALHKGIDRRVSIGALYSRVEVLEIFVLGPGHERVLHEAAAAGLL